MTIKVTLEYNSIDEAIVALGKLIGTPLAPVKERKGRADAGQKRGEYKPRTGGAAAVGATASPATATAVAGKEIGDPVTPTSTPVVPAAAAAAVPSPIEMIGDKDADAQTAIAKIYSLKGIAAVQGLLKDFGVNRVRDVPKAKRDDFLKAAAEAAA
jgi:hypothetical protein